MYTHTHTYYALSLSLSLSLSRFSLSLSLSLTHTHTHTHTHTQKHTHTHTHAHTPSHTHTHRYLTLRGSLPLIYHLFSPAELLPSQTARGRGGGVTGSDVYQRRKELQEDLESAVADMQVTIA